MFFLFPSKEKAESISVATSIWWNSHLCMLAAYHIICSNEHLALWHLCCLSDSNLRTLWGMAVANRIIKSCWWLYVFVPVRTPPLPPWNLMDDLKKMKGSSSILHQALCNISNPSVNSNWSYSPKTLNSGQNWRFFDLCDFEIWWMTLKNNRAPLWCCFKLCASFHSHRRIKTKVTAWKRSIRVKNSDLLSHVTLKFSRWPSKK